MTSARPFFQRLTFAGVTILAALGATLPGIAQAAISATEFQAVIDRIQLTFAPIVAQHNARLVIEGFYDTNSLAAMATRSRDQSKWFVRIWGGIPKFPSATSDTVTLIVCHELGHHLAGYPFYSHDSSEWAAAEGQADYWATQACVRHLWANDTEENGRYAELLDTNCESSFSGPHDINLCKRAFRATELNAPFEGQISGGRPSIHRRDGHVTRELLVTHPSGQCRVDSMLMGLLCPVNFDFSFIPGRNHPLGQNTTGAEREASATSCFGSTPNLDSSRPQCWFREAQLERAPPSESRRHQDDSADALSETLSHTLGHIVPHTLLSQDLFSRPVH